MGGGVPGSWRDWKQENMSGEGEVVGLVLLVQQKLIYVRGAFAI